MKIVVDDPVSRISENQRLKISINNLQSLFTKEKAEILIKNFANIVSTITVHTKETILSNGLYSNSKIVNGALEIEYGRAVDKIASEFISTHEFAHVLLTCINSSSKSQFGYVSSQGITKYNPTTKEFYGIALTDGLCNILAKLAILKKVNKSAIDKYIERGGYNIIMNENETAEDFARLLIVASTNDYEFKYSFGDVVVNNLGLDMDIKRSPYSNFITSSLDNNFEMENEFDYFTERFAFRNLAKQLDINLLHPYTDIDVLNDQIKLIEHYYFKKIAYLFKETIIDEEKKEKLCNHFKTVVQSVRHNLGIIITT